MANWRWTIDLKGILNKAADEHDLEKVELPCPDPVRNALAEEVSKAPPLRRFAGAIRAAETIAEVNRILNRVYEEADYAKVWCGL